MQYEPQPRRQGGIMEYTVLIVDDMETNIDILEAILSDDYNVLIASNGEEALKIIGEASPDLVLLDLYMPGMDGFEVLETIRKDEKYDNMPVLFVTGEHDSYSEEKGLQLGAVDYIKKPYNPMSVRAKVGNHIDLKIYRDNLEVLVAERTRQLEKSHEAMIMGMSLTCEWHDEITGEHLTRMKLFSAITAEKMSELYPKLVSKELARLINLYSPMHDIGKVSIPDSVLGKKGKLTDEEFLKMQSHTTNGAELLRKTESIMDHTDRGLQVAIDIAECHHEKYDGSGYPRKLKGEDIPLSARIVALADIYDALRSPRPYKEAFTHEEAFKIITVGDGRTMPEHFDPKVLEAFNEVQEVFKKAYK
jgi:putative two-component system response regulator